jgi:putative Holliday junction resolvase
MRILGLDLGERRVGVALSDPGGTIAQPLEQFEPRGRRHLVETVAGIVEKTRAERVVVGLPTRLDGTAGKQARRTEATVEAMRAGLGVPVAVWDERFTTRRAESALREAGLGPKGRKAKRDMVAATLILQAYLDAGAPMD